MKRTVFLAAALFALMAVGVYAQTEADFEVTVSKDGIGINAFTNCTALTSVTFSGAITSSSFHADAFKGLGDIRDKYLAASGGAGTYTRPAGGTTWTKK